MYKSESDFSAAIVPKLRALGFVQRIESGITSVGVPDIYMRTKTREYWIELKNLPKMGNDQWSMNIPWRRGQQSWARQYKVAAGVCSFTVVALAEGFLVIPMITRFINNIVNGVDYLRVNTLPEVVKIIMEWDE
jgi:hypothetical protein